MPCCPHCGKVFNIDSLDHGRCPDCAELVAQTVGTSRFKQTEPKVEAVLLKTEVLGPAADRMAGATCTSPDLLSATARRDMDDTRRQGAIEDPQELRRRQTRHATGDWATDLADLIKQAAYAPDRRVRVGLQRYRFADCPFTYETIEDAGELDGALNLLEGHGVQQQILDTILRTAISRGVINAIKHETIEQAAEEIAVARHDSSLAMDGPATRSLTALGLVDFSVDRIIERVQREFEESVLDSLAIVTVRSDELDLAAVLRVGGEAYEQYGACHIAFRTSDQLDLYQMLVLHTMPSSSLFRDKGYNAHGQFSDELVSAALESAMLDYPVLTVEAEVDRDQFTQ